MTLIAPSEIFEAQERIFNPFSLISDADLVQYAGKTIAVCPTSGKILASGNGRADLASAMRRIHQKVPAYNSLTLPSLEPGFNIEQLQSDTGEQIEGVIN